MYGSVPAMVSGGAGACAGKLVDLPLSRAEVLK
jgi:hypothetical protein